MKKCITAEELVKMELEYIAKQKKVPRIFDDLEGLVPANHNDVLYFFMQKHINIQYRNLTTELKHDLSRWQLTKFEMLMLFCYLGDLYEVFDKGNPKTSSFPINEMCQGLETALIKAPSCTEVPVVYRQHKSNNVLDFEKGETRTFLSYLTASINNWNQPRHQLIITPNLAHTKAKALYMIRNDKEEYQVNFKRGSSFLIERVETFNVDGIDYKKIWMREL